MYDAYEALPILEKLPLHIESIAAYGKIFISYYCLFVVKQKRNTF